MGQLFRRLYYLLNRRRFDEELQNDMDFHREMAAHVGRRNFGNTLRLREDAREAWGWTWIDRLFQDLRYATRMLRRSPGFTFTAVLVLAVGIGINVAVFGLFNLFTLKSLPIHDPDSLVRLQRRSPENSASEMPYPSIVFYGKHAKTLSAVLATVGGSAMELEGDTQPVRNIFVTSNYFTELGTSAALGRLIDPAREDAPDAAPVVVLSYAFWQQHFNADPSIVGRVIHLNRKPATVIGVAPYVFAGLEGQNADVWLPLNQHPYFVEGGTVLTDTGSLQGVARMWGRLAPGVTATMAEQELLTLTNELRKRYPREIWDHEYIRSDPGGHSTVMQGDAYMATAMAGALMLLILIVACANVGGLLLARSVTREHEISIRMAVGASKPRIFRQLFTESLLLAGLSAAAGLALGYAVLRIGLAAVSAPAWMTATPDWRVLVFAAGISLAAAIFFGIAPAWQIVRQKRKRQVARQVLVGAQLAASCLLLIVSGLLVRAVHHTLYTNPGFGYEQVLSIDSGLGSHGYSPAAAQAYLTQLQQRLRAAPGVISTGLSSMPPLGHGRIETINTDIAGHPVAIYPFRVNPDFFQTMSIPLLHGRNLLPGEANAVLISESLARRQWPGEDPVGKQASPGSPQSDIVVGVVGNARMIALQDGNAVETYHAAQTADMPGMLVVVKTAGAPNELVPFVKSTVETLDPKLFPSIHLLKSSFHDSMQPAQRAVTIVSLLGMIAMLLAGLGIVGLVTYAVSQRTKEIAIRLALGASKTHVLAVILGQFLTPIAAGLLAGTLAAAALSQLLRRVLFGISGLDPISYIGAIAILVLITVIAALLPARRALRVDPMSALHSE